MQIPKMQIQELQKSLMKLHEEFSSQAEILAQDNKEFHKSLIDLTSRYPEHKELIQFIVIVNDNLETNQQLFTDIVVDTFEELFRFKQTFLNEYQKSLPKQIEEPQKNQGNDTGFKGLWNTLKNINLADIKIIAVAIAIGIIGLGIIIDNNFIDDFMNLFHTVLEEKK